MERRRVLVSGGARGIGREIALTFAENGYNVVIGYNTSEEAAKNTVEDLRKFDVDALAVRLDVANEEEVKAKIKELNEGSPITVLVNNAGIVADSYLRFMSLDTWKSVLDVNLTGAFICSKVCLPGMLKEKWGRIINISSVAAFTGDIQRTNYAASKAGLIGLTHSLAREVATSNITVNAIAPGMIETDLIKELNEQKREALLASIPKKCFGTPKDVASLALFLASENAAYITGQTINIDGGLYMG